MLPNTPLDDSLGSATGFSSFDSLVTAVKCFGAAFVLSLHEALLTSDCTLRAFAVAIIDAVYCAWVLCRSIFWPTNIQLVQVLPGHTSRTRRCKKAFAASLEPCRWLSRSRWHARVFIYSFQPDHNAVTSHSDSLSLSVQQRRWWHTSPAQRCGHRLRPLPCRRCSGCSTTRSKPRVVSHECSAACM